MCGKHRALWPWNEPMSSSEAPSASQFVDYHEWQGTRDMAAYLATPAAIAFQAEHDWPAVRAACAESRVYSACAVSRAR